MAVSIFFVSWLIICLLHSTRPCSIAPQPRGFVAVLSDPNGSLSGVSSFIRSSSEPLPSKDSGLRSVQEPPNTMALPRSTRVGCEFVLVFEKERKILLRHDERGLPLGGNQTKAHAVNKPAEKENRLRSRAGLRQEQ